ncbi:hypothetical protein R1flu_020149 [Riccia fluitans]|uniref:PHD-type zinc finger plants domain-containing protein n=1 Tax=Riccia fluitans TaxID=41844 RepID=A0ABD1ZKP7_9MARC
MIGDMEKSQRQKQVSTDESNNVNSSETELGGGGGGVGSCKQTNEWNTAITRSGLDEQPQFKKPRLESSCVMTMMKPEFEDGAIILRNCEVRTDGDKGQQQQECSTASVGECSTCGDTGFQSELFRCTKCSVRLQHTYCSNSYNPNKRWFIGLCNWCELDVFRSGATTPLGAAKQISGTPTTITANPQGVTKGRDGTSTSSSLEPALERISRSVSAVAIDSLVGAASRLSDHGLTSLREESPPTAATGTSKGVTSRSSKLLSSFDKIENAKRSGPPSCNGAVKTSHKKSQVSSSGGGGEV